MWKSKIYTVIFLFFLLGIFCKKEKEKKTILKKEYYIVIDTSGSMAWGAFSHIQKRFSDFISIFSPEDTIYLISFDKDPKLILTVESYDDSQKEILENAVKNLKPLGLYTDFQNLIDYLIEIVNKNAREEIQETKREIITIQKQQYIVVLTDGKDEPYTKRKKVDIKEYESKEKLEIQDRYIYYVSFSKVKSKELENKLQDISDNVKTIERPISNGESDTTKDSKIPDSKEITDPTGIEEIKKDMESKTKKENLMNEFLSQIFSKFGTPLIFLIILLLLFFIIFFILYKKYVSVSLRGELIFYESGTHPSMGKTIKLNRFEKNTISIGSDPSCLIRIRSNEFPKKIQFKGIEKKGSFYLKIPNHFLKEIQFLTTKKNNLIESGDKFKIKNYIFEYSYGNKTKK
ncbi:MAG: vWA domain-containing protein [Leptonema sp. (in: bacteria)]